MPGPNPNHRVITHAHLFCDLGGGARGFNRATARAGTLSATFRCLGGIDVDHAAVRDFERLAGVPGTRLDLFDRAQYRAFHGAEPPPGWREATTTDVHRAFGGERPHILFLSPPCKGFSGLLSETKSKSARYQALNQLALRGLWLALEAYQSDPVELVLMENVPRIASRGRALLDRMRALLRAYGYAVAETTHDCGELGGLAQSRKRFLLVARHQSKVPLFLYEPPKRALRGVGEALGGLPMPGDLQAGPMHGLPSLSWQTWVRLAFVEAGSDWRSLARLRAVDGKLLDYGLLPQAAWQPGAPVDGKAAPDRWSVADLRHAGPPKYSNVYRVVPWGAEAPAVTSSRDVAVADPRPARGMFDNAFSVTAWSGPTRTITAQDSPTNGAMCVADPRPGLRRRKGDPWHGGRHFGVAAWNAPSGAVPAAAQQDNGAWSVADPRPPGPADRLVAVIQRLDGMWHRPFTTLELASLQALVDPEGHLELEGLSDAGWRERIGNAVPPDAAQAIAETMGRTLLMAWSGQGFMLSALPIWVRPMGVALSVRASPDPAGF